jgi:DNA-binding response OmpR family regulator
MKDKTPEKSILIIDAGKQRHNLPSRLRMTGFTVELVSSGFHGLNMLEGANFDLVIVKNHPEDMPSFEVTGLIRTKWNSLQMPIIFMQDREFQDTINMHREMGVNICVLSNVNFAELLKLINSFPKAKPAGKTAAKAKA